MKKTLFILFLLLSLSGCSSNVCTDNLGATKEEKDEKENIKTFETLYKEIEKKYKHVKKYEKDSAEYLVNEYETSKGEVGYQIIKDDGINLQSVCLGVECDGKNFIQEIIIPEEQIIIATSTK